MATSAFDKEAINQITPSELEARGLIKKSERGEKTENHGYECVYCTSGTGRKRSGALNFDERNGIWQHFCQACGNGGDNIKFFQHVFNADFADACRQASEMFNIPFSGESNSTSRQRRRIAPPPYLSSDGRVNLRKKFRRYDLPQNETKADELPLIQKDITDGKHSLNRLPESQRRGLENMTLEYFNCGYLREWIHPALKVKGEGYPSRRIIIPTSDNSHYLACMLDADRTPDTTHAKMHAGAKRQVFNVADLEQPIVIVVEGAIDAMSMFQALFASSSFAGFSLKERDVGIVATLSAQGWKSLIASQIDAGYLSYRKYIILLDADETGESQGAEFRHALSNRRCPSVIKFLKNYLTDDERKRCPGKVDANDILKTFGNSTLRRILNQIITESKKVFDDFTPSQLDLDFNKPETIEEEKRMTNEIANWQGLNGKIDPNMFSKIHDAASYLKSLVQSPITAEIAQSSETAHAIALCKFYDFNSATAVTALDAISSAKKLAADEIKRAQSTGGEFIAPPPDASKSLAQVSIRDIKSNVDKLTTKYRKLHKDFQRAEKSAEIAADTQRRNQETATQEDYKLTRIKELKSLPPSPDRDAKLIKLLCDTVEWKLTSRGDRVAVKPTQHNIDLILNHDPNLENLFGYDEFQQTDVFLKAPPWDKKAKKGAEWTDRDDAEIRTYLRRTYTELCNKQLTYDTVTNFSNAHSFHVVKEYFKNLPQWDGVKRAETLFIEFLGVEDTAYTREVTLNWLTAAVARIFHPGCRYQTALVLQGAQGIGKSYMFERIGGQWYSSIDDSVDDPHAVDTIRKIWVGEFKEMAAMRKAELNAIKSFIERSSDTRRFAYARRAQSVPRHCVFAITVNDKQFLTDQTGNRRYMILQCTNPQGHYVEGLTDDFIAQLWAEVYEHYQALFRDGFDESKLALSKTAKLHAEEVTQDYLRDDGMLSELLAWTNIKIPPEYIWQLFTRDERARFCANGGSISIPDFQEQLNWRCRIKYQAQSKRAQKIVNDIDHYFHTDNVRKTFNDQTVVFGSEYRQHVCTAEIFNEAFSPYDKRKSTSRVNELFNLLENHGWQKGNRYTKDPTYADQKKVLVRSPENIPENIPSEDTDLSIEGSNDIEINDNEGNYYGFPISEEYMPF